MNDYSQPDFYRFNRDSLVLVRWILEKQIRANSVLDLGAGCGIIGIELSRSLHPEKLVLVELQSAFLPHLELNRSHFLPATTNCEMFIEAFSRFQPKETFELIVCNPPYYLPGKGQLPENPNRSLARSFSQDGWPVLLNLIRCSLAPSGVAFVVIKNQGELVKEIQREGSDLKLEFHPLQDLLILEVSHSE